MSFRSTRFAMCALVAALAMSAACSNSKAQVALPDAAPLIIPQAPARAVVPASPDPIPAAVENTPATTSPAASNPPANGNRPNRDPKPAAPPPANPPAATPPAPTSPAQPTTPLETQANQSDLEHRARGLITSASVTLDKITYQALSGDGKAQYDTAKRFIAQAESALKAKNVVYAWQLADKANTIATLLLR